MSMVVRLSLGVLAWCVLASATHADEAGLTCEFSPEHVTLCGVDMCAGRAGVVFVPPFEQLAPGSSSFNLPIPARRKKRTVQAAFITSDINKMLQKGYFRVEIKPGLTPGEMTLLAVAEDRKVEPYELGICVLYSRF